MLSEFFAEHRSTARSFVWSAIASGSALSVCSVFRWQRCSAGRFHPLDACAACGGTITESGVVPDGNPSDETHAAQPHLNGNAFRSARERY